ncbi:MAG: ATP-dependent Clp protease ATP-binding subunit [Candidatus Dojkabacteria bacterium]|nr:MAG: ATP-dependent Clp protease ATP-binding subunit [Candidatus Dojkabacteria bacterium]
MKRQARKEFLDMPVSRFSDPLYFALKNAEKAAKISGEIEITPKLLFVGLLLDKDSLAFFLLDKLNIDSSDAIKKLTGYSEQRILAISERSKKAKVTLSVDAKRLILDAMRIAREGKGYYVGTEHILLALLKNPEKDLAFLADISGVVQGMPNFTGEVLRATVSPFEMLKQVETVLQSPAKPLPQAAQEGVEGVLAMFTEIMTAKNRRFRSTVTKNARKDYTDKIFGSFLRQTYKNVLLVGASGIGKSAVVEELAHRLITGDAPLSLREKQLLKINIPAMIAMAKFPNELDKQVLNILNEAYGDDSAVLFFDDIHTLIGSQMRGGMNMAMSMKPFLESGEVNIIATMPDDEYRALSDSQRGFFRYFTVIEMTEPSEDEAVAMIKDEVKELEKKHKVKIDENAVKAAVSLADSYLNERVLPDKAVELLDIAASKYHFGHEYSLKSLGKLIAEENEMRETKERLIGMGDYDAADALRKREKLIQKRIKEERKAIGVKKTLPRVKEQDIKNLIAELTKLPVATITNNEMSALVTLEASIRSKIISQEDAIKRVVSAVKRGRIGISDKNRPWASLLFLGPTGVGKTELAKVLSRLLFGDNEERLIQIDMSEFMEQHSVSKLIGSPPGYVGFEQGGMLSEKIMDNPYSVVLFDEIEKAHPEVLNILLQILEDGHLTDSRGNRVSFQNTIVILTSNIGAEKIAEDKVLGFYRERTNETMPTQDYEAVKDRLMKELKKRLRPELINRLDDVVIFKSLTKDDASKVLEILVADLAKRIEHLKLSLQLGEKAKKQLLHDGFSNEYGARQLRRMLQHEIEDLIADHVLEKGLLDAQEDTKKQEALAIDYDSRKKLYQIMERAAAKKK